MAISDDLARVAAQYTALLLTGSVEFGTWSGAGGDWAGGSTARTFVPFSPARTYAARVFQTAANRAWDAAAGRPVGTETWTIVTIKTANQAGVTVVRTSHGLLEPINDNNGSTDQIELVITAMLVHG
jgi:hypothetical protein